MLPFRFFDDNFFRQKDFYLKQLDLASNLGRAVTLPSLEREV